MKAELTKAENNLLSKLIKDFENKVNKSKKLSEEHQLILTLAQKSVLSDADAKKLKLLLEFEQSKIRIREKKKQAKQVLKNHESEKKEIIENRYKRFGIMTIESLKKLPNQKATISLSDFLLMMLDDENLTKSDKDWISSFLVKSNKPVEQVQEKQVDDSSNVVINPIPSVSMTSDNFS